VQTLSEIRDLLAERGLRPKRHLGQHFLHDHNQLKRLVEAAAVVPGEVVLEIGPGTGTLTETLVEAGADVVASEIDAALADIVRQRLGDRITLVEGDCLGRGRELSGPLIEALGGGPFVLVANLPYQVASPLILTLLLRHPMCRGLFVTIQREVADRLAAEPGGREYGALTIIVRALADVAVIANLPPACFWPPPKVDSSMFAVTPRPGHGLADPAAFARFVTTTFTKRRKQLGTIFGRDTPWPDGVTPKQRPETLAVEQFIALHRVLVTHE
jgi:16S rRNA (adenine1518-N6/adenine1519-N6)-dimethyltransferase